ncbi:bacteriocin [Gloeocapsopsis crepidinum LEGE 06123]|uniref:Bacteriocin n=1 Tax=Gloeocapsopsis crepidinum LEGE 06123 TaxID=588587 RepID=A0ABR9UUL7_9CHRO|nr:bacteriocin [Gloeocapsopsis crepidinum]MBE9192000.1 bacteriocin [Gloeocapsopsis crepidinum LEGE 06123]
MSCLKISDLSVTGLELFQDAESFLNELSDREMENITGGWFSFLTDNFMPTTSNLVVETVVKTRVVSVVTKSVWVKTKGVKTYGISHTYKTISKQL